MTAAQFTLCQRLEQRAEKAWRDHGPNSLTSRVAWETFRAVEAACDGVEAVSRVRARNAAHLGLRLAGWVRL